jgi:hypothetical protein
MYLYLGKKAKRKYVTFLSNTECDKHNVYIVLALFRTLFRKPSLQIKENKRKEASTFIIQYDMKNSINKRLYLQLCFCIL